jgi:hypothetical protein
MTLDEIKERCAKALDAKADQYEQEANNILSGKVSAPLGSVADLHTAARQTRKNAALIRALTDSEKTGR